MTACYDCLLKALYTGYEAAHLHSHSASYVPMYRMVYTIIIKPLIIYARVAVRLMVWEGRVGDHGRSKMNTAN